VTRVRWRDRKTLGTGRVYNRLCQECFGDLLANDSAPDGIEAGSGRKIKGVRDSDVA
jgi:hypothetical protein